MSVFLLVLTAVLLLFYPPVFIGFVLMKSITVFKRRQNVLEKLIKRA